jgi:hypothetical protein
MSMRPDPTFHAPPKLAMEAPPENFGYTLLLSPDFSKPDALAVIDVKPGSPTLTQVVLSVVDGHPIHAKAAPASAGASVCSVERVSTLFRDSLGRTPPPLIVPSKLGFRVLASPPMVRPLGDRRPRVHPRSTGSRARTLDGRIWRAGSPSCRSRGGYRRCSASRR